MKNFDIEQLKRENIYKTPENFFAGTQENVLKRTVCQTTITENRKPEAKIIPKRNNWIYAAAAIALLLGFGFFMRNTNVTSEKMQAKNKIESTAIEAPSAGKDSAQALAAEIPTFKEPSNQDLTFGRNENPTERRPLEITKVKAFANARKTEFPVKAAKANGDEPMEQLLTSFTSAELAEMSKDAEMDVYLDLYN